MKIVILGSTGMLGQALTKEAFKHQFQITGIARKNADICCDITNDQALTKVIELIEPHIIINAAAIVNIKTCEEQPSLAYLVNARPVAILAEIARQKNIYLVQISTDHYYTGDMNYQHNEMDAIRLPNEYARTKYVAEYFALNSSMPLVIRTNIVGFRGEVNNPTFLEWVLDSLTNRTPMTLFNDFFTSSIDVTSFAKILFNLLDKKCLGVLNVASREVFSKRAFIEAIADDLGVNLLHTKVGSVLDLNGIPRAESLGLDVSKVEQILGYKMPTMLQVINELIAVYKHKEKNNEL
jgi:dTDP-4-dehydrorhamnose reductase